MVDLKIDVKRLTQVDIINQAVKHNYCFVLFYIWVFAKKLQLYGKMTVAWEGDKEVWRFAYFLELICLFCKLQIG